ncbi:hypothetical protein PBY51_000830 [Eleginops maclovinus]|uniref:Cadherin domain-containing protein n=1 Tax=Eleginops maclovinus TaxID=56733 RepID=A0AAN8AQS0_ELEMC|nr:hypothetical protein PBY51_000830 [Eleginops maclovinus]
MRTCFLLLLVASIALAESFHGKHHIRDKRELLQRAKRRWVLSTIEIEEEDPGPYPIEISKMFNDQTANEGQYYQISGSGVTEEPLETFKIDAKTGIVYALKSVDREFLSLFHIKFDIFSSMTGKTIDKQLAFDVQIKDINDNAPVFSPPTMEVDVPENMQEGKPLVNLKADDIDDSETDNSKFTFSLVSQNPTMPKIELEQRERVAVLSSKGCFDYNKEKKYDIIVQAKDHGTPSLTSTAHVTLNIVDTNNHPPMFEKKEYQGQVDEAIIKDDILRIDVVDKDTPNTPGWRAKYSIISGNEDRNYKIDTDPITNQGILSVIKGKDFERTHLAHLRVEVQNEEPLVLCKDYKVVDASKHPAPDTADITIKVIDVNDAPVYEREVVHLYMKEEEEPGKQIFTPTITDAESDAVRHVVLHDPAAWVAIDKTTGTLTSTQKMDRESSHVDENGVYKVLVGAIDDGEPPATGTCTILIHLKDVNDNKPRLVNNGVILCGNKAQKIIVEATDNDDPPFSGPFAFSLEDDDKTVTQQWKLDPSFGEQAGLISLTPLPYHNYSIQLLIQDQQSMVSRETVEVMVCDCGEGVVCKTRDPLSSSLGKAGIGLLFLGLLLFLLLIAVLVCNCNATNMVMVPEEGNQTLIKYNQEGGGSTCQTSDVDHVVPKNTKVYSPVVDMMNLNMTSMGTCNTRDTFISNGGHTRYNTWNTSRTNTYKGVSSTHNRSYNRSYSLWSNDNIAGQIDRRLFVINGTQVDHPVYPPHEYAYEGQGSKCPSLDKLSLGNPGEELTFLEDLEPKFRTLAGICGQTIQEKNIKL